VSDKNRSNPNPVILSRQRRSALALVNQPSLSPCHRATKVFGARSSPLGLR
jgi:hypothetical protein